MAQDRAELPIQLDVSAENPQEFTILLPVNQPDVDALLAKTKTHFADKEFENVKKRAYKVIQALDHILQVEQEATGKRGTKALNKRLTDLTLNLLERYLVDYEKKDFTDTQPEFNDRRYSRLRVRFSRRNIQTQIDQVGKWDQRVQALASFWKAKDLFSDPAAVAELENIGGLTFEHLDQVHEYETSDSMVATEFGYYDLRLRSTELKRFLDHFPKDHAGMVTSVVFADLWARREKAVGRTMVAFCEATLSPEKNPFLDLPTIQALEENNLPNSSEDRKKLAIFKQSSSVYIPTERLMIAVRDAYALEQKFEVTIDPNTLDAFFRNDATGAQQLFLQLYPQVSQALQTTNVESMEAKDVEGAFRPKSERGRISGLASAMGILTKRGEQNQKAPDVAIVFHSDSSDEQLRPAMVGNRNPADPRDATPCVYGIRLDEEGSHVEDIDLHFHHPQTDASLAADLYGKDGPIEQLFARIGETMPSSPEIQTLRRHKEMNDKQWAIGRREEAMGEKVLREKADLLQKSIPDVRGDFVAPPEWKKEIDDRLRQLNEKVAGYIQEVYGVNIQNEKIGGFLFNFDNLKALVLAHAESCVGIEGNGFDWLITSTEGTFAPVLMGALEPQEAKVYGGSNWKADLGRGERLVNLGGLHALDKSHPLQLLVLLGWVADQSGLEGPLSKITDWLTDKNRAALVVAERKGLLSKLTGDGDIESFTTGMLRYFKDHFAVSTFKNKHGENVTRFRVDKKHAAKLARILTPVASDSSLNLFQVIYERMLGDMEAFIASEQFETRIQEAQLRKKALHQEKIRARMKFMQQQASS